MVMQADVYESLFVVTASVISGGFMWPQVMWAWDLVIVNSASS